MLYPKYSRFDFHCLLWVLYFMLSTRINLSTVEPPASGHNQEQRECHCVCRWPGPYHYLSVWLQEMATFRKCPLACSIPLIPLHHFSFREKPDVYSSKRWQWVSAMCLVRSFGKQDKSHHHLDTCSSLPEIHSSKSFISIGTCST